jgi:predicted MFS family arabinose efflux permease
MIEYRSLDERQAGVVASTYFATYFLTGASAFVWIHRFNWRRAGRFGYLLMTVGLVLAARSEGVLGLALALAVSGAGGGILFALGVAVVSASAGADRNFGWVLVAQQTMAALLLMLIPTWAVPQWGFAGSLWVLAVATSVLATSSIWIPRSSGVAVSRPVGSNANPRPVRWTLAGLVVHFTALSALWAFVDRLGASNALTPEQIGNALALSMLGGLLGAFLVIWLADRFGRRLPLWASAIGFAMICSGYARGFDWIGFVLLTGCLSFTWNFVLAYQMGIVASLDVDGHHAVLMPAAQAGGAMLGPALGGWLITSGNYNLLMLIAAMGVALGTAVFSYFADKPPA